MASTNTLLDLNAGCLGSISAQDTRRVVCKISLQKTGTSSGKERALHIFSNCPRGALVGPTYFVQSQQILEHFLMLTYTSTEKNSAARTRFQSLEQWKLAREQNVEYSE